MCDQYVCVVQRRCNLTCGVHDFDVRLARFRACAYEFEVMECCATRNCGAFILYVRSNVCANVKMGTVVVGYGSAVYGRLSFTNDILVSLMYVAGSYL